MDQVRPTLAFWLLLSIFLNIAGCKDDTDAINADRRAKEQTDIAAYLTNRGLSSVKTASGLHHILLVEGSGITSPTLLSDVEVNYRGQLLNGNVFDQSPDNKTVTFELSQVILGWQEGLQLMKLHGKSILIVPSDLGYGARSLPGIPANSVLVFDVELVGFN